MTRLLGSLLGSRARQGVWFELQIQAIFDPRFVDFHAAGIRIGTSPRRLGLAERDCRVKRQVTLWQCGRRCYQTTWDWMESFAIGNRKCHVSGPCPLTSSRTLERLTASPPSVCPQRDMVFARRGPPQQTPRQAAPRSLNPDNHVSSAAESPELST